MFLQNQKLREIDDILKNWDDNLRSSNKIVTQASFATDLLGLVDDRATFEAALRGVTERADFAVQACFVTNVARKYCDAYNTSTFIDWCDANVHEF